MALVQFEGGWLVDRARGGFGYIEPGYYDPAVKLPEPVLFITERQVRGGLIALLESEGLITPRLDERLRTEDLKITHRVIDLLDKAIGERR